MGGFIENILPLIEAGENIFLRELQTCKDSGLPTYIYGAGEGAENVSRRSRVAAFSFAGKLVDRKFYSQGRDYGCLEEVLAKEKMNLVVAHRGFKRSKLEPYRENIGILIERDCFAGNYEADPLMMSRSFIAANASKLTMAYNALADEKSKQTYIAYINQKISMDYRYLRAVKARSQYFDSDIIHLGKNEAFVDAGAYTGDTVDCFIERLRDNGIESYAAIYAFEPDPKNYEKLIKREYKNFYAYCLATSDCAGGGGLLSKGKGSSSRLAGTGISGTEGCFTNIDTIDHILHDKAVTFIKMDVEGYELASLKGARETIERCKPRLAICIYHKRQDLWEIQDYIRMIMPDYQFYVRAYDDTATELVLYAILPDGRKE